MLENQNITLLDCSLRDGGYYNNWDFKEEFVDFYRNNIDQLPFDYIEIGYRNLVKKEYRGKYFYTPSSVLDQWTELSSKLVLMLDEINTPLDQLEDMILPCKGKVRMFRIATKPDRIAHGIELAKRIKEFGFEVGLNVMYLSEWDKYDHFFDYFTGIEEHVDYLYMADSFGAVLPDYIEKIVKQIKSITSVKLGYHGHNNLEMGLINALTAIVHGVEIIDASITGMGRGAGNLKTELLLTYLSSQQLKNVKFEVLNDLVLRFEKLQKQYQWGNNLAYMVSGANSIPQKEVMNLITRRFYSIDNAIKAIGVEKDQKNSLTFPKLNKQNTSEKLLIVGGGSSVVDHLAAIETFIEQNKNINILFSSARHQSLFPNLKGVYNILVGAEGKRLEENIDITNFSNYCVLPPAPHKISPYIPKEVEKNCFELNDTIFSKEKADAHLAVTLQVAIELDSSAIFLVGFDGYSATELNDREAFFMEENQMIFDHFLASKKDASLESLTPTQYKNISVNSIYALIK